MSQTPVPPDNGPERPSVQPEGSTWQPGEPPYRDRWEERAERHAERARLRAERRSLRNGGGWPWFGGVVLILLGLIFLLQNMGFVFFNNWWALFILIPAVASFAAAWGQYQAAGVWTAGARGSLIAGLIFTLVAGAFLFNLNWGLVWPVLLILAGIGALLSALLR